MAGNLGAAGDVGSICAELVIGSVMDIFGRKTVSIGGLLMVSVVMACKPLLNSLTALYALKILTSIGVVPLLYSPYSVDYV